MADNVCIRSNSVAHVSNNRNISGEKTRPKSHTGSEKMKAIVLTKEMTITIIWRYIESAVFLFRVIKVKKKRKVSIAKIPNEIAPNTFKASTHEAKLLVSIKNESKLCHRSGNLCIGGRSLAATDKSCHSSGGNSRLFFESHENVAIRAPSPNCKISVTTRLSI
ncbi:MAG: hypothetical protein J6S51_03490 [Kiritimatiellae bacterium]|nr:hypothetical protein [Kiritimatiellia bacterium]